MIARPLFAFFLLSVAVSAFAREGAPASPIQSEGRFPLHLQGVCRSPSGDLYWSWTDTIAKTDAEGKLLAKVAADNHQGDLCYLDGRVYVAVNLGRFNRPPGEADSWIYVFDGESLELLEKHPVPELVHGAGGIANDGERFLVVGGLPPEIGENTIHEYDLDLRFVRSHVLPTGYTHLGIQTVSWAHGAWWFGCYGKTLLRTDSKFRLTGQWEFDAALGIEEAPEGRFLIGRNRRDPKLGFTGSLHFAVKDKESGLRISD